MKRGFTIDLLYYTLKKNVLNDFQLNIYIYICSVVLLYLKYKSQNA